MAQQPAASIRRFSALVDRLAERGISTLHFNYSNMGWSLVVAYNQTAVQFTSETLDGDVTVSEAPLRESTFPNEWSEVQRRVLGRNKRDAMIAFVADYLTKRFP